MQRLLEQADISQHRKETRPPVPPIPVEWIGRDITFASNVPGVEEIGSISIPYARLPARAASAYRPRYTQWTDLADEVMEDLMALPGAGERTIRALAKSHGAQIGDTVVLIFDTAKETLTARRIPAGTTGEPLLELLLGTKRITLRSIATRLDCSPQDVHDILIRRGDTAVADVVTRVCQSPAPK